MVSAPAILRVMPANAPCPRVGLLNCSLLLYGLVMNTDNRDQAMADHDYSRTRTPDGSKWLRL